jgi:hypothetical protein
MIQLNFTTEDTESTVKTLQSAKCKMRNEKCKNNSSPFFVLQFSFCNLQSPFSSVHSVSSVVSLPR